jgi:hypothetical protein
VCSIEVDAGADAAPVEQNVCANLLIDPMNCGSCGTVCEGGTFCSPTGDAGDASACGLGCFGGTIKCGTRCVQQTVDPFNCGGCNNVCTDGGTCVDASCQ